uniref:Uncharacterized protein n=1 Tax=Macrostomum lignano TaxID=282301 RepID=A0A1I8GZ33_9PLAT
MKESPSQSCTAP